MKFNQTGYGSSAEGLEYWSTHRSQVSDLYKSERHFFIQTISNVQSVLDLGCAAGGSLLFSREINPKVKYTGIDISSELIAVARKRFEHVENSDFIHFDGDIIPLADASIDFGFSFGVFHHLNDWKAMANEFLRVSNRYVLFDLRLWENESLVSDPKSFQRIALGGEWDGKTIVQYNIQSFNEVLGYCSLLKEKSISSSLYGYYVKPTSLASTPAEKVLTLAILLEKNSKEPFIKLYIED